MRPTLANAETRAYKSTSRRADYLEHGKHRSGSAEFARMAMYDAAVGFGLGKGSSKMH